MLMVVHAWRGEETMKNLRMIVLWAITMTILLLAMPSALAKQGKPHREKGDVWVGCIVNAPATTWEKAFTEAFSIGNEEGRSCWVNHQKSWWFIRWIEKIPIVRVTKTAKEPTASAP